MSKDQIITSKSPGLDQGYIQEGERGHWLKHEHQLRHGESIEKTQVKELGKKVVEALLGTSAATPLAFLSAPLLIPGFREAIGAMLDNNQGHDSNHADNHHILNETVQAQLHAPSIDFDNHNHHFQLSSPPDFLQDNANHHIDFSANLELQNQETNYCPLNYWQIPGAMPLTSELDNLNRRPMQIPCVVSYDAQGNATLKFPEFDITPHLPLDKQGERAVLITPVAALTQADGSIPILIQYWPKKEANENAVTLLCPHDIISNFIFGNTFHGSGFTSSSEATVACYNAAEIPVPVFTYDRNGTPHEVTLQVENDGNMLLLPNTFIAESGQLIINMEGDHHSIPGAYQRFLQALRGVFGEEVVILFSPEGMNPHLEGKFPVYEPPPAPETATPIPPVENQAPVTPTQEQTAQTILQDHEPRTVLGTEFAIDVRCGENGCPRVYRIQNTDFASFEALLQLYQSGNIFNDGLSGPLIGNLTDEAHDNFWEQIGNWWTKFRGGEVPPNPVRQVTMGDETLKLDKILYVSQNTGGGNSFMLGSRTVDGETRYYLIQNNVDTLSSFDYTLRDSSGQPDLQGSAVMEKIQLGTQKLDATSYSFDSNYDLVITPPHTVTDADLGMNLFFVAEANSDQVVTTYQVTPEGLVPAILNMGVNGKYSGHIYEHPTDGQVYIGITAVDKAGVILGEYLVPAPYIGVNR